MTDILERAKAAAKSLDYCPDFADELQIILELIAEVEKWKSAALDETKRRKAVAAELGATQNEVERLRSENERLRTANASDDWGNPLVLSVSGGPYTESDKKDARITELGSEVKRLRSENDRAERAHESLDYMRRHEIASLNARIKELKAEAQEYHDKKEEALTLCAAQIEALKDALVEAAARQAAGVRWE